MIKTKNSIRLFNKFPNHAARKSNERESNSLMAI